MAPARCKARDRTRALLAGLALIAVTVAVGGGAAAAPTLPTTPGWHELPGTKIRPLCPTERSIQGIEGCRGMIAGWNGGAFDGKRNRMLLWGGGHNAYYGNEIYAVDLNAIVAERVTDPGLPAAPYSCRMGEPDCIWGYQNNGCSETVANGTQPNSRHSYDGFVYMPNVDRMFVFGGALACGAGYSSKDTWTFDFAAKTWKRMRPAGAMLPKDKLGVVASYDPATGHVLLDDLSHLFSYDFATNSYTRHERSYRYGIDYHLTSVIDPKRRKFVMVGNNQEWIIDIDPAGSFAIEALTTTGDKGLVRGPYPGLAYDPATDRIVGWNGGDNVYSLNLDTRVWSVATFPGGPRATGEGTYKRWSYVPALGAFVVVNSVDVNAYLWRPSAAPPPLMSDGGLVSRDAGAPAIDRGVVGADALDVDRAPSSGSVDAGPGSGGPRTSVPADAASMAGSAADGPAAASGGCVCAMGEAGSRGRAGRFGFEALLVMGIEALAGRRGRRGARPACNSLTRSEDRRC